MTHFLTHSVLKCILDAFKKDVYCMVRYLHHITIINHNKISDDNMYEYGYEIRTTDTSM